MTTQSFTEKAVKSGYVLGGMDAARTKKDGYAFTHKILLDPQAWNAVGKTEGWEAECVLCGAIAHFDHQPEWLYKMHGMIDALAEGKTIEEYLANL